MALKDALECLEQKHVLGEYGPQTRPFVVLDVIEYEMIVRELKNADRRRKVPREAKRETAQTV